MKSAQRLGILLVMGLTAGIVLWIFTTREREKHSSTPKTLTESETSETRSRGELIAPHALSDTGASVTRADAETPTAAKTSDGAQVGSAWIVRGRTLLSDGSPLGEAGVELALFAGSEMRGEAREKALVTSDRDGAFAWQPAAPLREHCTLSLRGKHEGYFCFVQERDLNPEALAPTSIEVKFYALDVIVRGAVKNEQGDLLAGAQVKAAGSAAESGTDGRYELRTTAALDEIYVETSLAQYAAQRQVVKPNGPGAVIDLDFVLGPAFQVRGRVLDEDGQPVEGARVTTFFSRGNAAMSDAEGRYEVDQLDPKRENHSVYARKDGYCEGKATVKPRGTDPVTQDLVLKRGVRVDGVVIDVEERPVAGAELYIGFSPNAYNRLDARSDAAGKFSFSAVEPGTQTIVAQHSRYAPGHMNLELAADEKHRSLRVVLQRAHFAAGIVRDESGTPCGGVRVAGKVRSDYIDARAKTDDAGRFRIEGLPENDVTLEFYGQGLVRLEQRIETVDCDDLAITMQRAGKIAGRVVDAETGLGLDEFVIRFINPTLADGEQQSGGYSATWAREGQRFSRTDGWWDSGDEELKPGTYLGIEARAPGRAPKRAPRVAVEIQPDRTQLVIELASGGRIEARVRTAEGAAVVGAKLSWRLDGAESLYVGEQEYEFGTVFTDARGDAALDDVPPGRALLRIAPPERPAFDDGPFEVQAGETTRREIVLPRGLRLDGMIQDENGAPITSARIRIAALTSEHNGFRAETTSNAAGAFTFENLIAGRYDLTHVIAIGDVHTDAMNTRVEVAANHPNTAVLRPEGTATLRGSIRCEGEVPEVIAVNLTFSGGEYSEERGPINRGALAQKGRFEITGLRSGQHLLSAHIWRNGASWHGAQRVEVVPGEAPEIELEIKRMTH